MYVSKDVRIRGYFSKPKGGSRANSLVNNCLHNYKQETTAVFKLQPAPTNRNMSFLPTHATVGSIESELQSYQSTKVPVEYSPSCTTKS